MAFKRKVTALAALLILAVQGLSIASHAETSDSLTAGQSDTPLNINQETGDFSVDAAGLTWLSSPALDSSAEQASGVEYTNQRSLMIIEYLSADGNVKTLNSYAGVINDGKMAVNQKGNSTYMTLYFSEPDIIVPLKLTFDDGMLVAAVETKMIKERSSNKLLTITLLPYFGAGKEGEDGYLLIPDGSGAIIRLEKTNAYKKDYEKPVYGENLVLYKKMDQTEEEQIYLPAFGIKRNSSAMLGIITRGDGVCSLVSKATTNGYFAVCAKFIYRQRDEAHLMEGSLKEKRVSIIPKAATETDFEVRYSFLQGEKADYAGMANEFKDYLIRQYGIKAESGGISLDLAFTATAEMRKSFLGIPYTGLVQLATLSDVERIASRLTENGSLYCNLSLRGAFAGGMYGKIPDKVKLIRSVGSLKGYKQLQKRLQENNMKLYLLTNFQRVYKSGNGVSSVLGTARDVGGAISKQYLYYPENFARDESLVWRLANARSLEKITTAFAKNCGKNQIDLGLYHMADELYGDYRMSNTLDRAAMLKAQLSAYQRLYEAAGGIYYQGANIYAIATASMISNVPTRSSQYDLFSQDVPFYQIVLSGICDYSADPVNLTGDSHYSVLKSIEYGSAIRYDLICQNRDLLYETSESRLFSSDIEDWMDTILDTDKAVRDFYYANKGSSIVSHKEVAANVFYTEYENGNASLVNYSGEDVQVNGVPVKSRSYTLLMKGV